MTWFDGLVLVVLLAVVGFELRQEAGRGLLDTIATLGSLHFAGELGEPATALLRWRPAPGGQVSPAAFALLFLLFWVAGLILSAFLHRQTRWSMDGMDPVFGAAFGLVIAALVGHVLSTSVTGMVLAGGGALPPYLRDSLFVDELRDFRTYRSVVTVVERSQRGWSP